MISSGAQTPPVFSSKSVNIDPELL